MDPAFFGNHPFRESCLAGSSSLKLSPSALMGTLFPCRNDDRRQDQLSRALQLR